VSASDALRPLPTGPISYELQAGEIAVAGTGGSPWVTFWSGTTRGIQVTFDDHRRCPRPRTPAGIAHDRQILEWATSLEKAGFADVRTGRCAALGIAPQVTEPLIARVVRDPHLGALGRTVTFDGYRGTCRFELNSTPASAFYQATGHTGAPIAISRVVRTDVHVVEAIAAYYGFPNPVQVLLDNPGH
jgi:hypothetical protein